MTHAIRPKRADSAYEFAIWAKILRCASRPDGLSCGAQFDANRTDCFEKKQAKLITLLGCVNDSGTG